MILIRATFGIGYWVRGSVSEFLTLYGVDAEGWQIREAYGVSGDGRTIVGRGVNPNGEMEVWMAKFDFPVRGDANGDGVINNADISAFVLALTNPVEYQNSYPDIDPSLILDFDGDGEFTNGDISGFVDLLTNG